MADTNDGDGEAQTNSIGDMLGMDVADATESLPFDWSEDTGEPYREYEGDERTVAFDILWDETGTYPPTIDSDVVHAILDDTDHWYQIEYDDETRRSGVTGIALYAYLDDDAEVSVDDE